MSLLVLPIRAEDWTVDGKDFHNVKVTQIEPDQVHIAYDGGIGSVLLADLPPDLKKRFGYDPVQAKAAENKKEEDAKPEWEKINDKPLIEWVAKTKEQASSASSDGDQRLLCVQIDRLQLFHKMIGRLNELGASDQAVAQRWIDCVMTNKICVGMPKLLVVMAWGDPRSTTTDTGAYGSDFEMMDYSNFSSTISISNGFVSNITQTERSTNY